MNEFFVKLQRLRSCKNTRQNTVKISIFFIDVSAGTTALSGSELSMKNDSVFVNEPQKEYASEVGDFVDSDEG